MDLLASDMQIPMEEDGSRGVVRGFRRLVDLVIVPVLCGPLLHSGASVDQCFLGDACAFIMALPAQTWIGLRV